MPTIDQLRERSARLTTELLTPRARPGLLGEERAPDRVWSWFDPDDAAESLALAFQMALRIAAAPEETDGMGSALDLAEEQAREAPAEMVAKAMALLTTHNTPARALAGPRVLRVAPELFVARDRADRGSTAGTLGPFDESALDYWREDPFANEHHMHWHDVYPWAGVQPADMTAWAGNADPALLAALFTAFDPEQGDWGDVVASADAQQRLEEFDRLSRRMEDPRQFGRIMRQQPVALYRLLYHLKDRQGELFLYMHSQMLARYDAERAALGADPVGVYGPAEFAREIPEGYDSGIPGFGPRRENQVLDPQRATVLATWQAAIEQAVDDGKFDGAGSPAVVPVDRSNLGEVVEASQAQLLDTDGRVYGNVHNVGHGSIAALSPQTQENPFGGVMNSPQVAIMDPIFWRWHRNIDGVNVRWQDTRPAYDLDADAPPVELRSGAGGSFWHSQDVLLVPTDQLPEGADGAALAAAALGTDDAWELLPGPGPIGSDGLVLTDELTTRFVPSSFGGTPVTHLTHDPFALVVRLRNTGDEPARVTLRTFLALTERSEQREHWIELDKWAVDVPAGAKHVVYRPDTEFAVVKKPAEPDPQSIVDPDGSAADPSYCNCGWPYTLLLPRGTADGSSYRMVVVCTDTAQDAVNPVGGCGSLSFCGAVDEYPDRLDMGYPFSRTFAGSIENTLLGRPTAAGRGLVIRHVT